MTFTRSSYHIWSSMILFFGLLLAACGQQSPGQPADNAGGQAQPASSANASSNNEQPATNANAPSGPDSPVSGQPGQGGGNAMGLQGTVTDSTGQPVAGVMVVPQSTENPPQPIPEIAVMTTEDGRFQWSLPPGAYKLTFNAEGFAPTTQDVTVQADAPTALDVTLQK